MPAYMGGPSARRNKACGNNPQRLLAFDTDPEKAVEALHAPIARKSDDTLPLEGE
jgi:hypothetical protein